MRPRRVPSFAVAQPGYWVPPEPFQALPGAHSAHQASDATTCGGGTISVQCQFVFKRIPVRLKRLASLPGRGRACAGHFDTPLPGGPRWREEAVAKQPRRPGASFYMIEIGS